MKRNDSYASVFADVGGHRHFHDVVVKMIMVIGQLFNALVNLLLSLPVEALLLNECVDGAVAFSLGQCHKGINDLLVDATLEVVDTLAFDDVEFVQQLGIGLEGCANFVVGHLLGATTLGERDGRLADDFKEEELVVVSISGHSLVVESWRYPRVPCFARECNCHDGHW